MLADVIFPVQDGDDYIGCNTLIDAQMDEVSTSTVTCPPELFDCLSEVERERILNIQILRESNNFGYDIFVEAVNLLERQP